MTEMTLRRATPDDFDQLYGLYKELVGEIDVISGPAGRDRLDEILNLPGTSICVAARGDVLLGAVTLHVLPNMTFGGRPYALIENVVTSATHRGQGIGRAVMRFAQEQAWEVGVYKIMLLTGKELGARGFYESLGYSADEKHGMTLRRAPKRQPKAT